MKLFGLWLALFLMIVTLPVWAAPLDMEAVNAATFEAKAAKSPDLIAEGAGPARPETPLARRHRRAQRRRHRNRAEGVPGR